MSLVIGIEGEDGLHTRAPHGLAKLEQVMKVNNVVFAHGGGTPDSGDRPKPRGPMPLFGNREAQAAERGGDGVALEGNQERFPVVPESTKVTVVKAVIRKAWGGFMELILGDE